FSIVNSPILRSASERRRSPSARGRFCFRPCLPDSKKSSRHAARRCASTPTSRDTSSKDSPRNSRNTTSILRLAHHPGLDRKSPASSLDTDMSTMLAPLYRLSNDSGCGGLAGCSSALTVDVGQPFNGGVTYDIVLCLEAECWQDQVIFKDRVNDSGDPLLVEHKGTISVHLPNVPRPLTSQVSLTVWADGAEMVDHQGQVLFQVFQPNGPSCEPTCYHGVVTI